MCLIGGIEIYYRLNNAHGQYCKSTNYETCQRPNSFWSKPISHMPEVLAGLLHDDNITYASAQDASTGLKLAREQHFDLILLDLGLPGVNGFKSLRRAQGIPRNPNNSRPWCSRPGTAQPISCAASRLGANEVCLTKPFEPADCRTPAPSSLGRQTPPGELTQANRELIGRTAGRRSRNASQSRIPGQYQPRNPHPHERHHRHVRPAPGNPL